MLAKPFSVHVGNRASKEQTYTLLLITWFGRRNYTKSVFKPFAAKKRLLYLSTVHCSFPLDYTILVNIMTTLHSCTLRDLFTWQHHQFLINWNEKQRSESNMLTMDHKLFVESSSSAAINTRSNISKAVKYLHNRLRQIYCIKRTWNLRQRCERLRMECFTMAVRIRDYYDGN